MVKRLTYIDIAKGIGILSVIVGHTVKDATSHSVIFSFHMPLFFILGGCFIKPLGIKENFIKVWKSLLVPYLFSCVISLLYTLVDSQCDWALMSEEVRTMILVGAKWGRSSISFMPVIWFLPVLAVAKLITQKLLTYQNGRQLIFAIAIISLLMTRFGIIIPFGISQAMTASLYLLIGKVMMEKQIAESYSKHPYVLLFALFASLLYCDQMWTVFQWNKMPFGIFNVLSSSFIVVIIISLCRWLDRYSDTMLAKSFIWIGFYSLIILCVHFIDDKNVILDGWLSTIISTDNSCVLWICAGILRLIAAASVSYVLLNIPLIRKIFNYSL